jgi:hypothetical protein
VAQCVLTVFLLLHFSNSPSWEQPFPSPTAFIQPNRSIHYKTLQGILQASLSASSPSQVMASYERELRDPVRSLLVGQLSRSLLIQVKLLSQVQQGCSVVCYKLWSQQYVILSGCRTQWLGHAWCCSVSSAAVLHERLRIFSLSVIHAISKCCLSLQMSCLCFLCC